MLSIGSTDSTCFIEFSFPGLPRYCVFWKAYGSPALSKPVGAILPTAFVHLVSLCCCCCVASVVSDSVRPHRWQPTRLPRPWDSPGKNTGVGCHFLLQCRKVKSGSEFAQSCATPWTSAFRAPLSVGFSRQEYWSGVPLPSPWSLCYLLVILTIFQMLHQQKSYNLLKA